MTLVEASLARAYLDQATQKGTFNEDLEDMSGIGLLPPHFYRELARTEEGCRLLRQSGHFHDFASCVRDFRMDEEDIEVLTKAKGCLWAIGNVGSMELGAPFLEESEIVGTIVKIAEYAEVISMRGTACFVLGLLSRSTHGYEMLREHGWDTAVNARGQSLGLCMPNDLDRLCLVSDRSVLAISLIGLTVADDLSFRSCRPNGIPRVTGNLSGSDDRRPSHQCEDTEIDR